MLGASLVSAFERSGMTTTLENYILESIHLYARNKNQYYLLCDELVAASYLCTLVAFISFPLAFLCVFSAATMGSFAWSRMRRAS